MHDRRRSDPDYLLEKIADYHRRRLLEMGDFERALTAIVFSQARPKDKVEKADRTLLAKPLSYQTLATVWMASPFSVGSQSYNMWECESVYSLATDFAADGFTGREALMQYVTRVIDAAERAGLVTRQVPKSREQKIAIRATALLHKLMEHQALTRTEKSDG